MALRRFMVGYRFITWYGIYVNKDRDIMDFLGVAVGVAAAILIGAFLALMGFAMAGVI